ncbi:MAG TPA: hypothetical protein PKD37_07075 [Oligoflexia bacterium]|nr:hypothetical protein [Oligoflexia bacterium]HMP27725.1 hypothetical protein [Oligoflexia bacterium]
MKNIFYTLTLLALISSPINAQDHQANQEDLSPPLDEKITPLPAFEQAERSKAQELSEFEEARATTSETKQSVETNSNEVNDQPSLTIQRAKGAKLAAAIGYFARTRSLLIAALREFDAGLKIADPSMLLDTERWRASIVERASELERILDPQPIIAEDGVKFKADPRLISGAK